MLFTQKLTSRVLVADEVHADMFKGANRVFKQVRLLSAGHLSPCPCLAGGMQVVGVSGCRVVAAVAAVVVIVVWW